MAETFQCKRIKLDYASESSSDISDTESIDSFQGRETELVRDTSDTSGNSEFQVSTIDDSQGYILSTTDESELEGIAEWRVVVATIESDDNLDILGDISEENSTSPTSNSDVDPELPRSDYLDFQYCLMCKTEDKNISYPYCPKCFLQKKSFFPPRPEKMRKRENLSQILNKRSLSDSLSDVQRLKNSSGKISSQESSYDDSVYNSSQDESLCKTCYTKKMSGVFVHGSTGHMHSCFTCAKKTWQSIGVCPLCRKKCKTVIKLFTSIDKE